MAPRPRQTGTTLPPYVYLLKGRYVLRRYDPATQRQREIRLCRGDATMASVWAAYEALSMPQGHDTFRGLSGLYQKSPQFAALSSTTRRDYAGAHRRICAMALADGRLLGDLPLATWTPPLVQRWQDRRGEKAPVTCNREKSYMARVFAWGLARGHVATNPVRGIQRLREHASTRYVTDAEYLERLQAAASSGTPYLVPVMELAYLLRARLAEVLDFQRGRDLLDEGIHLRRRKGSKDSIVAWTPRLRDAVAAAKALHGKVASRYLIAGKDGGRMHESTVQTAWSKRRLPWPPGSEPFTIHALKAKGVTDTRGDKLAASGHRDPRMLAIYDRLPGKTDATR